MSEQLPDPLSAAGGNGRCTHAKKKKKWSVLSSLHVPFSLSFSGWVGELVKSQHLKLYQDDYSILNTPFYYFFSARPTGLFIRKYRNISPLCWIMHLHQRPKGWCHLLFTILFFSIMAVYLCSAHHWYGGAQMLWNWHHIQLTLNHKINKKTITFTELVSVNDVAFGKIMLFFFILRNIQILEALEMTRDSSYCVV